jgi:hypothetical protein
VGGDAPWTACEETPLRDDTWVMYGAVVPTTMKIVLLVCDVSVALSHVGGKYCRVLNCKGHVRYDVKLNVLSCPCGVYSVITPHMHDRGSGSRACVIKL